MATLVSISATPTSQPRGHLAVPSFLDVATPSPYTVYSIPVFGSPLQLGEIQHDGI